MTAGMFDLHANNYHEAEYKLERALHMMRRQKSPDIPRLVSCLVNLSVCYERNGKLKEAGGVFPLVIKGWTQHMKRGGSMVDIDYAATHSDFGRGTHEVAEFYLKKVIPMRERKFPKGHHDISNSYVIAARLLRKLGRNEEADELKAKAAAK